MQLDLDNSGLSEAWLIGIALEGAFDQAIEAFRKDAIPDDALPEGFDRMDLITIAAVTGAIRSLETDGGVRIARDLRERPVYWLTYRDPEAAPQCEDVSPALRRAFALGLHKPGRCKNDPKNRQKVAHELQRETAPKFPQGFQALASAAL